MLLNVDIYIAFHGHIREIQSLHGMMPNRYKALFLCGPFATTAISKLKKDKLARWIVDITSTQTVN